MAKTLKTKKCTPSPAVTSLTISLYDPGLTPILRAGLGGLAAAVTAIGPEALEGAGTITVEPTEVTLTWPEPGGATHLLQKLFAACFRIDDGLIDLPGTYDMEPPLGVRVALNDAVARTFLHVAKSTVRDDAPSVRTVEIDDVQHAISWTGYRSFAQQGKWKEIGKLLDGGRDTVKLAGWANPGAMDQHSGLSRRTAIEYRAHEALCACFAIVGCISLQGPNHAGVLLIPEPSDLRLFAEARPQLSPRTIADCFVGGAGDGVLLMHCALRSSPLARFADGIAGVSATLSKKAKWSRQHVRTGVVRTTKYSEPDLQNFHQLLSLCPARVQRTKRKMKGAGEAGSYGAFPSALRGFVADNLAHHRPFYAGFATAKTDDNPARWLCRVFSRDDDPLGALCRSDLEGIMAMVKKLENAEQLVVKSVHTALRHRIGAIGKECSGSPAAFRTRRQHEIDSWRFAFTGARTHLQMRKAIASLWCKAGNIRELSGDGLHVIQPLLGPTAWESLRDLALIALASYHGKGANDTSTASEAT